MKKLLCLMMALSLVMCVCALAHGEGASYSAGDTLFFGSYEQDNDYSNFKEPIEWIVLEVRDDGGLVIISRYALDVKRYNKNHSTEVTWETCTLREWLNDYFYNMAFSPEEQAQIIVSRNMNEDNPTYGTLGGNETDDMVWLLSLAEAEKYFADDEARMCVATVYTAALKPFQSDYFEVDGVGTCRWWLRSPGINSYGAAIVTEDGDLWDRGTGIDFDDITVRPVMLVLP